MWKWKFIARMAMIYVVDHRDSWNYMSFNYEMLFEMTMQIFLGDKAYQIAGQASNDKYKKEWYKKALKKVILKVQKIETSTMHSKQLAHASEQALKCLENTNFTEAEFSLHLLRLTGVLIGIVPARGACIATPMYYQTHDQYFTEVIINGGDTLQDYYDKKNSVAIRRKIILQLKQEGLSDFDISLVLNTSEYQVKKLRKEL